MKDVLVIGGGISGLSCAWQLKREGLDVLVLEAYAQPGGNLRAVSEDGYTYDMGPHSFIPSADAVWDLVDDLKMNDHVVAAAPVSQARYIWRNGRLNPLPMSPGSFVTTGLLSMGAKLRLMAEPLIPGGAREQESAADFFRRRLGDEATKWVIGPFVSGIYGGDPERLGARDAFPKMWRWERDAGSMIRGARRYMKAKRKARPDRPKRRGLFSFRGGMVVLTDRLAKDLGTAVQTDEPVRHLKRLDDHWFIRTDVAEYHARSVVLAIPPGEAAALIDPVSAEMATLLRQVEMAPMAVVHLGIGGDDATAVPDGFGFLVPRGQNIRSLGCIFMSKLYPERAPDGHELLSFYIGGVLDADALSLDDAALIEAALTDTEAILGRRMTPVFTRVLRHAEAIPQMVPGHLNRIAQLKERTAELGALVLAGNYLSGVGMNDSAESGRQAADMVLADLAAADRDR